MRDRWDRGEIGNRHYGRLDNDRNNQYNNRNNRNDRYTNGNNRNNSYRFDHNKGLERNSSTRITVKKRDESGSSYNRGGSSINRGGNSNGGNRNSGNSFRQSGGSRQSQMKTI